jgi:asparagine synthase (glutamine-hydrolysing)
VDESIGIYVGWTALEGSFDERMPLRNKTGNACLIFSGEEYSNDGLSVGEVNGSRSNGLNECSYLLERFERDRNAIQNLNGMFHGVFVDQANNITLFNDRFGMHRLCYHEGKDSFYFASEAKAIATVCPELRACDPQSLGEFTSLSCVLENRTIFKHIFVLPAGSTWVFRDRQLVQRGVYFSAQEWENQSPLAPEPYYQELRSVLEKSLPGYFVGRRQIGMAMTGGLDTRVILSNHPRNPGSIASFTFAGPFRESQDVFIGRQIARLCKHPYEVIRVNEDFLKKFSDYAERAVYIAEGTVGVGRAADLYLSERARAIAPVKVVGTYGSEILRHAVMFKPMEPSANLLSPDFLPQIRAARATYGQLRQQHPVTFAAFSQSPLYHHGILALEQSVFTVRSPFLDNEFVRTVYRAPKESGPGEDIRMRLIMDGNPELGRVRSDRGIGGNGNTLSSAFMRAYQEFTFKAEYAYDYGMPQSVAQIDHWLSWMHLERLFLGRHKLLHFRLWYRTALAQYVQEMLLDPRTLARPYLNRSAVEAVVSGHLKGNRNYTSDIHRLLSLELLQRLFFDGGSQSMPASVATGQIT